MDSLLDLSPSSELRQMATGTWFIVQWTPDLAIQEKLNIGVGFVESEVDCISLRMLETFERFTCLYEEKSLFHIELACDMCKEALFNCSDVPEVIAPNLRVSRQGFAQGQSVEDVLSSLFDAAVPLGRRKEPTNSKDDRFQPQTRFQVASSLKGRILNKLGSDGERLVPANPYLSFSDDSTTKLYLPFRTECRVATVASAVYAKAERAKQNAYEAYFDIQAALEKQKWEQSALFILRPELGLAESVQAKVDEELDVFYWVAKKRNIRVEISEDVNLLADSIIEWSAS